VLQLTVCDLTDRAKIMTRYQLSLEAENLPRRFCGSLRNPNPYAVVKVCGGPTEGTVVGRTEPIRRTLQPDWVECLFLDTGEPRCVNMDRSSPHYVSLCGRPLHNGVARSPVGVALELAKSTSRTGTPLIPTWTEG
jgi:C2 domain